MAYTPSGSPFGSGGANPTNPYGNVTSGSGTFIPEIWSGKLVEKFYKATVLAAIANTDYEGEIKNMGDTVKIRQRPDITINDYAPEQTLLVARPSAARAPDLAINKGKYFNLALDDVEEIQSDIDMMSIWAEDAAEQMKIAIDRQVLISLTIANSPGSTILAANSGLTAGAITGSIRLGATTTPQFIHATGLLAADGILVTTPRSVVNWLVDMGQVMDEQNLPESGRWVVIPAVVAAMIKRSDLKDASLSGDGSSMLRNGRLGMIDRFTLYMSNNLPFGTADSSGLAADEYAVYFGIRAGLTFASQFTKMETMRSELSFANLLRGLQVYGFQIVTPKAIGRSVIKVVI